MRIVFALVSFIAIVAVFVTAPHKNRTPEQGQKAARPEAPPQDSSKQRWHACYEAHRYIEAALKAPTTADFPNCYSQDDLVNTKESKENPLSYVVTTYVDAQNAFGAKLRNYYMCPVVYPDADHVQVRCIETDSSHTTTLNVF